jgi:hypothetical protein
MSRKKRFFYRNHTTKLRAKFKHQSNAFSFSIPPIMSFYTFLHFFIDQKTVKIKCWEKNNNRFSLVTDALHCTAMGIQEEDLTNRTFQVKIS